MSEEPESIAARLKKQIEELNDTLWSAAAANLHVVIELERVKLVRLPDVVVVGVDVMKRL